MKPTVYLPSAVATLLISRCLRRPESSNAWTSVHVEACNSVSPPYHIGGRSRTHPVIATVFLPLLRRGLPESSCRMNRTRLAPESMLPPYCR